MSPTFTIRSHNVVLTSDKRAKIAKRLQSLHRYLSKSERAHFDVVLNQIGTQRSPHYYVSVKVSSGEMVTMSVHSSQELFTSVMAVVHSLAGRLRRRQGRVLQSRSPMHISPMLQAAACQSW